MLMKFHENLSRRSCVVPWTDCWKRQKSESLFATIFATDNNQSAAVHEAHQTCSIWNTKPGSSANV